VQRFGWRARLLAAVEDGDVLRACGQGGQEGLDRERPVQPDGDVADLLAAGDESINRLTHRAGP
jgi:hypothetical protein